MSNNNHNNHNNKEPFDYYEYSRQQRVKYDIDPSLNPDNNSYNDAPMPTGCLGVIGIIACLLYMLLEYYRIK